MTDTDADTDAGTRQGRCLCGAIRYTVRGVEESSACHCDMCRRWAGGPLFAVGCKELTWEGDEPKFFQTSEWAERGFCPECGSSLVWRMTAGVHAGMTTVTLGSLDDQEGLPLTREWFIDRKPDGYALAGEHQRVTEAEAVAMFSGG